jgi:hypothetical protein
MGCNTILEAPLFRIPDYLLNSLTLHFFTLLYGSIEQKYVSDGPLLFPMLCNHIHCNDQLEIKTDYTMIFYQTHLYTIR